MALFKDTLTPFLIAYCKMLIFLNLSRHIYAPTQILLYGRCADFYLEL